MASSGEIEKLERRWAENQLGLTFAPLAEAYRKAGDPERALLLLQTGMTQHPNYIPAHIVKGRCYLDAESDGEAELSFLRVTDLDPENVIALKSLAEISERAGRIPEAMRRLEMLLDIDRNNEEARGQLDRVREVFASLAAAPGSPPEAPSEMPASPARAEELPFMEPFVDELPPAPAPVEPPAPPFGSEFQLRNDAETLFPSDDRLEDIVLSEDTELEVPEPVGDEHGEEAFVLSAGEYSSAMAYEPPPPQSDEEPAEPEPEPEPTPEPAMAQDDEPVEELVPEAVEEPEVVPEEYPDEAAPVVLEVPVSFVDVQPPPPPADSYESYLPPPPASDTEIVPEGEETEEPAPSGEPELVVTETMAEIFLRQGHRELALAVYTQLSQREPGNDRIAAAVAGLKHELAPPAAPPPPPVPAPHFAASETGGRSVHALLGELLSASRPAVATAIHPPAFEPPRPAAGEPTRPAQDALNLSAVFGDEAAPSGPAAPPVNSASEPSFDQFFAPGASAESELPKPPDNAPSTAGQVPEDLEQFNAWLRGLKR